MKKALIKALKSAKVEFLRSLWCDKANVIRAKSIDSDSLEDNFETVAGISRAQQGVPVMYDGVVPESGLMPVGEIWLNPDWDTLNILPYTPGHASVISDLFAGRYEWSLCPRLFLKRAIKALDELGFTMRAAFENEFYLFDRSLNPVDSTLFASSFSMNLNSKVVGDIIRNLKAQFLTVERYYAESGPGQQEVVIAHAPALETADNQITFRETVRTIAARNGLIAFFMPKPFEEFGGSGCHLHFSLLKDGKNVMRDHNGELSEVSLYFMAGLLEHLPSLMAVTTPTNNSYRRIKPSCWAGALQMLGAGQQRSRFEGSDRSLLQRCRPRRIEERGRFQQSVPRPGNDDLRRDRRIEEKDPAAGQPAGRSGLDERIGTAAGQGRGASALSGRRAGYA